MLLLLQKYKCLTGAPLSLLCMDLITMKSTRAGNRYALTMIDHFSKFAVAIPIEGKTADNVARAFINGFVLRYGAPRKIYSDRGTEFVNETLRSIAEMLGCEQSTTRGYDPAANGAIERFNGTIKRLVEKQISNDDEWDEILPFATYTYNSM